jgi:biopolymer transport protein ExbD
MDEFAEINITPFTDVLLVLLIIFMLLATLVAPAGFERQIPCGCIHPTPAVPPPHSELVIARNGRMSLDGHVVDARSVYPALGALHASHKRVALSIFGDTGTAYEYVIRAMDAAKAAGITDVSFVVL